MRCSGWEWSEGTSILASTKDFSTSLLTVGTHTISFRAQCANGIWSPKVSTTVVVNPADAVTIGSAAASPATSTYGTAVSFTGSAADSLGHTLSYQWLEGTTVLASSASFSKSNLSVGTHTLTFKATCSSGLSATRTVTVTVNAAPVDTVTAAIGSVSPNPATAGQTVSFTGSATDSLGHAISGWEWSEGTSILASTKDFSTSLLTVGTHTIGLRAQCANGSWSPKVSTTVVVNPADAVTIGSAAASPATSTYGTAVSFTGSAADSLGHTLSYQWLEGTTVLASSASFSKSNLSVGTHTLTFKATCSSGLSATRTVSVTVEPVDAVTISSATASPSTSTYGDVVSFSALATDSRDHAITYEWSEGASVLSGSQSFSTSSLAVGAHTLTVKATCSAGLSATKTVTVTVQPVDSVTISSATASPASSTYGTTVSFSGRASDSLGHTLSYQWLEGTTVLANTASFTRSDLSVGTHTLTFKAACASGLSAIKTVTVTVTEPTDITPPITEASGGSDTWAKQAVVTLSATDDKAGTIKTYWRLGTDSWNSYTGPVTISTEGAQEFGYYSVDAVGNSEAPKSLILFIDATAPALTVAAPVVVPEGKSVTASAQDAHSGVSSIRHSVDGGTWKDGATALVTGAGSHNVKFEASDAAGNTGAAQTTVTLSDAATALTLAVSPSYVAPGTVVTFTGRLTSPTGSSTASQTVAFQKQSGKTWVAAGFTATTDAGGNYTLAIPISATTSFRTVFAGSSGLLASTSSSVKVRVSVSRKTR